MNIEEGLAICDAMCDQLEEFPGERRGSVDNSQILTLMNDLAQFVQRTEQMMDSALLGNDEGIQDAITDVWDSAEHCLETLEWDCAVDQDLKRLSPSNSSRLLRMVLKFTTQPSLGVLKFLFAHYTPSDSTPEDFSLLTSVCLSPADVINEPPADQLRAGALARYIHRMKQFFLGPLGALLQGLAPRPGRHSVLRKLPPELAREVAGHLV